MSVSKNLIVHWRIHSALAWVGLNRIHDGAFQRRFALHILRKYSVCASQSCNRILWSLGQEKFFSLIFKYHLLIQLLVLEFYFSFNNVLTRYFGRQAHMWYVEWFNIYTYLWATDLALIILISMPIRGFPWHSSFHWRYCLRFFWLKFWLFLKFYLILDLVRLKIVQPYYGFLRHDILEWL